MFQIEMRQAPGITEEERRRRMHQAYEILLSVARRKKSNEPPEFEKRGARPFDTDLDDRHQSPSNVQRDLAPGENVRVVIG